MGAYLGLDYNVLFRCMDDLGLRGDERQRFFYDMRVLESAAMDVLNQSSD